MKRNYINSDRKKMLFDAWVNEDQKAIDYLQLKKIQDAYLLFIKHDAYNKEVNTNSFANLVKDYLFSMGLTNPSFRKRKKVSVEKEATDKALEDNFHDIIESMSWLDKFEFIRGSVAQMVNGRVNSIYIYGNPETGKSHEVISALDKLGADYKLYKGNVVKTVDDLYRIFFNNKKDKILIFDDADKVLTLDPNIWKTVLENKKTRTLTYVDVKRNRNKNMSDITPVFDFTSGVIFISNVPKLNSAIASRSLVMNVKLSNEEALSKVESTLKDFLPEVSMSIKTEALEYAKEISGGIKNMGYRTVETIIIAKEISPANWKKQAIWLLSSR